MTIDSFNNYKQNLLYLYYQKGISIVTDIKRGSCDVAYKQVEMNVSLMFINTILCYDIESDNNYLSVEEMKGMTNCLNKVFGTNYCVDYELT